MRCLINAVLLSTAVAAAPAAAQAPGGKPLRLVNLFVAGSTGDVVVRTIGRGMSDMLGQQVIVENVPGAGGVLAAERVARAAPDGNTLLVSLAATHVLRIYLAKSTPFHPVNDFTPITTVGESVSCFVVNASLPVKSLQEFIQYAKANPGKVSYGSSGEGSPSHLAGEALRLTAGIDMVHMPYKATAQALQDLVSGRLPASFAISASFKAFTKAGKVRPIAIVADERFSGLPDVPTIREVVPGYEAAPAWMGMFGPAKLPEPLLKRLHADAVKVLNSPGVSGKLAEGEFRVMTSPSPEQFLARIRNEVVSVGEITKRIGIQPQ